MKRDISKKLNINPDSLNAYSSALLQGTAYSRLHTQLNHRLESYDLSIPEWKLLGQLHEHGRMKLADLASYLSYDPPMVTKLAKSLEKKKLLKRSHDTSDERSKFIFITTLGTGLIIKIEPELKKTMATILSGVTREELSTYIKVLTKIVDNTNK